MLRVLAVALLTALLHPANSVAQSKQLEDRPQTVSITTREGTWLALDVSPDGRNLAFDLLGQIWIMPSAGGRARALTDAVRDSSDDADPAFSPDGTTIVFSAERGGSQGLWLLTLATGAVRRISIAMEWDGQPAWSPDGKRIAFVRVGTEVGAAQLIKRRDLGILDLATGAVSTIPIGDSSSIAMREPAWSPDGRTVYVVAAEAVALGTPGARFGGPIWSVHVDDRFARMITDSSIGASAPDISPDGRALAHFAPDSAGNPQLWTLDLVHGARRQLTRDSAITARRVRWTPDGKALLFVTRGRIHRLELNATEATEIPFVAHLEFARARPSLPPRSFPSAGQEHPARGFFGLALSPSGRQFAMLALGKLWVTTVGEEPRDVAVVPREVRDVEWAPAEDRILFAAGPIGEQDLYAVHLASGRTRQVTGLPGSEVLPRVSPDGRRIAFVHAASPDSAPHLAVFEAGAEPVTEAGQYSDLGRSAPPGDGSEAPVWSPDGRTLLLYRQPPDLIDRESFQSNAPMRLVSLDGTRRVFSMPMQPTFVQWLADGSLRFLGADRVWRADFDTASVTVVDPTPLGSEAALYLSSSRNGTLLFVSSGGLTLRNPNGHVRTLGWPLTYRVPPPPSMIVRNARIVDGSGTAPSGPMDLHLSGGRIVRITPAGRSTADSRIASMDAEGGIVLPGLIDLHFHHEEPADLRGLLYYGVTSARDQGSRMAALVATSDGVHAGSWPGPAISFGAFQFYSDAPYSNVWSRGLQREEDPGHLRRAAQLLHAFGADHMKIRTFFGWPIHAKLIAEAHRLGLRTTSHCAFPLVLIAAGLDTKEHLGPNCTQRSDAPLRDDFVQLYRASGITINPTIAVFEVLLRFHDAPASRDDSASAPFLSPTARASFDWAIRNDRDELDWFVRSTLDHITDLHRGGIVLGAGTDTRAPAAMHLELEALVRAGLTPLQAITAATATAARTMGYADELGTIATGKRADLIVLEPGADPVTRIGDTRRIRFVIQGGHQIDREALRKTGR